MEGNLVTNRIINKFIQHLINNIDIDLQLTEEFIQISIKYMGKIVVNKKLLFNIENWMLEESLKKNGN
jgi:frataxin-like iron-binding protein CyaY